MAIDMQAQGRMMNKNTPEGKAFAQSAQAARLEIPNYGPTESEIAAQRSLDQAQAYQGRLADQAAQYQSGLPGLQNQLTEQSRDVGRRDLASNIMDARRAASSRGLLYSGIRQGAENQAGAGYLSGVSQARAGINQETQGNLERMQNQAKEAGIGIQSARQGLADQIYQRNLQQYRDVKSAETNRAKENREKIGGMVKLFASMVGGGF